MPNDTPNQPGAARRRPKPGNARYIVLAAVVALTAVMVIAAALLSHGEAAPEGEADSPAPVSPSLSQPAPSPSTAPDSAAAAPSTPPSTPSPTPEPTPEPYDFTLPAPEGAAVDDSFFDDAVFIGDSRTDGLRLYGGIDGAEFIQHTGIMVFEVADKRVIRVGGEKYTVLEALALKQYGKVYVMLGVNELGWYNDPEFEKSYAELVDSIRAIQPNAVVYLQTVVPVNEPKAKANGSPYYVTNDQIAVYNEIITRIAAEKRTVLVDVGSGLLDEDGILPADKTNDGVHFTKDYYVKWHEYLSTHTVDAERYWAGQTTTEGA